MPVRFIRPCLLLTFIIFALAGCLGEDTGYRPIETGKVIFWDGQGDERAKLIQGFVESFNANRTGLKLEAQYSGNYTEIYRKVGAGIQGRVLPAMAVAYESMTAEYVRAAAVAELDGFVSAPGTGFSQADLDDFFPAVLATNRYPDFENRMYSFPFCKSVLMLYCNTSVLAKAGISTPPRTWDEFLDCCRKVTQATGQPAYACHADLSTLDGMIYSMGGEVYDPSAHKPLFTSEAAQRVFQLHETMTKEKLAYQIPPNSYDDRMAFSQGRIAFMFRSSSHRGEVKKVMNDSYDGWGMAPIPQADPANPATVLYGPNICIFNVGKEQQQVAWDYTKHFTSADVNVKWALGTGYVPIRRSAANHPDMKAFWAEAPCNKMAFDCLEYAKAEPNVLGWQEVRDLAEKALTSILSGQESALDAAATLQREAEAVIAANAPGD